MHARAVPVAFDRLGVQVNDYAVFFCCPLQQVSSYPHLVTGAPGTLGKNLKFPLPHHHFRVYALDIEASGETQMQVLVD